MKSTSEYHEQFQSPGLASWGHLEGYPSASRQFAFKNILFATDFSSTTELGLPYAVEIARRSGGTIHAVHVVQPDVYPLLPPSEWPKIAEEERVFREEKRNQLEQELEGVPHDFLFPAGDVWKNLAHIVQEKNIDLLILGTHGRTGMAKVLVGSIAEKAFRQATCPVLTVGPAVASKTNHALAAMNRILYATDFSRESLTAVPYAVCLAKKHGADLILMHSVQNEESVQVDSVCYTLRDVVPAGAGLESKVKCVVERGAPEEAILRAAKEHEADLIILGVRNIQGHPTAIARLSRSIAYKVVTGAACPVLTVRG